MNIPTTIPTNSTYWTNFPKQENFYAVPYTWWSSFKKIAQNVQPTGQISDRRSGAGPRRCGPTGPG